MNKRNCPECGNLMSQKTSGGITLDSCDNCGGVFLDYAEITSVLDSIPMPGYSEIIEKGDDKKDHDQMYICASCGNRMTQKEYAIDSGTHIDFCEKCYSVYLNKGELEDIKKFLITLDQSEEGINLDQLGTKLVQDEIADFEKEQAMISQTNGDLNKNVDILGMDNVMKHFFNRF